MFEKIKQRIKFRKLPKKIRGWAKHRTRVGVKEKTRIERTSKMPEKNAGLPDEVENDHLHCPCTICGHTYQAECEESGCDCCSSLCT